MGAVYTDFFGNLNVPLPKESRYDLLYNIIYKKHDNTTAFSDVEPDSSERAAEPAKQLLSRHQLTTMTFTHVGSCQLAAWKKKSKLHGHLCSLPVTSFKLGNNMG